MSIQVRNLERRAAEDPLADMARRVAAGILGIVSGDWTWPGIADNPTKAAAVTGCYHGLRHAQVMGARLDGDTNAR